MESLCVVQMEAVIKQRLSKYELLVIVESISYRLFELFSTRLDCKCLYCLHVAFCPNT